MENKRKLKLPKIILPKDWGVWAINTILLTPAIIFWTSVVLYTSLGTDYVFDVVLAKLNESAWGNVVITLFVMGFPAMVIAVNGMEFVITKKKKYRWPIALGGIFLLIGFFAILRKN